ncbi:hypothetical protein EVAR_86049_1 [Eumeta japonica]|uniref:Uncharacterized protein n=1 Tax=Eumeta variegata TaxID=151549 RepID=A0A4C1UKP8_EUMVA|nr:hypothetical protein EVAR_86049_1 [Eumeta japonica]
MKGFFQIFLDPTKNPVYRQKAVAPYRESQNNFSHICWLVRYWEPCHGGEDELEGLRNISREVKESIIRKLVAISELVLPLEEFRSSYIAELEREKARRFDVPEKLEAIRKAVEAKPAPRLQNYVKAVATPKPATL